MYNLTRESNRMEWATAIKRDGTPVGGIKHNKAMSHWINYNGGNTGN